MDARPAREGQEGAELRDRPRRHPRHRSGADRTAHQGAKAYAHGFELLHRREATRPNEIWQADHTQLDILVLDEAGAIVRPWLTVIIDDHSGLVEIRPRRGVVHADDRGAPASAAELFEAPVASGELTERLTHGCS